MTPLPYPDEMHTEPMLQVTPPDYWVPHPEVIRAFMRRWDTANARLGWIALAFALWALLTLAALGAALAIGIYLGMHR